MMSNEIANNKNEYCSMIAKALRDKECKARVSPGGSHEYGKDHLPGQRFDASQIKWINGPTRDEVSFLVEMQSLDIDPVTHNIHMLEGRIAFVAMLEEDKGFSPLQLWRTTSHQLPLHDGEIDDLADEFMTFVEEFNTSEFLGLLEGATSDDVTMTLTIIGKDHPLFQENDILKQG